MTATRLKTSGVFGKGQGRTNPTLLNYWADSWVEPILFLHWAYPEQSPQNPQLDALYIAIVYLSITGSNDPIHELSNHLRILEYALITTMWLKSSQMV